MSLKKSIALIVLILLIDQIIKFYIKTHFVLGYDIEVLPWFKILFVENPGMAWGAEIPGLHGKLALTLFRLAILPVIGYWLYDATRKNGSRLLLVAISFIFAGALGNIIDSVFYGVVFSDSTNQVATFLPDGGGYGEWFRGEVVDMLYFPIWKGYLPEWLPIWGGDYFTFFNAVFNIADTAISMGIGILLVFNKKVFPKKENEPEAQN